MQATRGRFYQSERFALIANLVGFQCCWAACVVGGSVWASLMVPLFYMWHWHQRHTNELVLIAAIVLFGTLHDSLLQRLGLFAFPEHSSALIPVWLILLWSAFAATLLHSLSWLLKRPWLAALFGGLGAPWSYYAGSLLNSIELTQPALAVIALSWAVLLGTVSLVARKYNPFLQKQR